MQLDLDNNSDLFNLLIEESAMPIALYEGENMVIKVANKAILKAWEKDCSVIGMELAKALPELDGQPFMRILEDVYTTGIAYEAKEDKVQLIQDGVLKTFYFDFTYKPLKDINGKVCAILNNATDVTALVTARLRVKRNEVLFRKIIRNAPVAIGILRGEDFVIEEANNGLLTLWGKSRGVIGSKLIDGLPELVGQPFLDLLSKVYTEGTSHYGNETLARIERNGVLENCFFNFVYDPIRDENNQITGIMIVANEVTNQVKTRERIAESEERFKNLLLENPMPMALYETEDIIIRLANDEMLKMWDKDKSVIGKPVAEGIPELVGQPFVPILKEVYRTGVPYHGDQQEANLMMDGELKKGWYNFTYKPLKNAEGVTYGILHGAIDVTKLVQLQKQKDEFLGVASHELKTPVTSIKAYTQVLEKLIRNEGDEKKANMVRKMDQQLNRLTGLIGDLLDVTKIQSGRMVFNQTQFDFDLAIEEVIDEIQHTTSKHHINADLQSKALIYADKERIGQVIINFLSNAIKYSTDSHHIDVKSYLKDEEVVLSVRDYGIGISSDLLHLVFDQFYRVGGHLLHTYPGLGLGLYISAEIIKSEGGRIWVESDEGAGSTFYFALKV
ncbi:PAS domain-containing sensor histidine kinase [Pedobacter punctiformis]|uniref:histidine kinase n=1 Tax=Pedobacter punctiformis TaxID=3004097 RepID=A0ABT4LA55_9SPHI|nr:PAS domain-containing sensor histidine kinase [Pedobacter sp. HCMS5-2]MCZ4244791.1 PAS domain-containing protein [Pedobacter sp. HCMS5-2]